MALHNASFHQKQQIAVIDDLEQQVQAGQSSVSTVDPVSDFSADPRICLTNVHFPNQELIDEAYHQTIEPLHMIEPAHFYYPRSSLHMTIKNIRVINDPPHFTDLDIETARKVFSHVVPKHHAFRVYFYRLLLFPNNLDLIGTTDPELDAIILDLDEQLRAAGLPDDKKYLNNRYFFTNMTLARFTTRPSQQFQEAVARISSSLTFDHYFVDSVTLIAANATLVHCRRLATWPLSTDSFQRRKNRSHPLVIERD